MDVFTPNELIRAVWAHPPRPRQNARVGTGVWHITTGLLRDGGILNSPDAPRSWRWPALLLAGLYQLLWCFVLLWLMYFRFLIVPWAPPEEGANTGSTIEVRFIDDTRPPEAPALPTPLPEPIPAPLPPPLPEITAQLAPEPPPPVREEPEPVPAPPTPPLMVTEVDVPDEDAFTLNIPEFKRPEVSPLAPDLPPAAQREVSIAEVPLLQHPDQLLQPRAQTTPALPADVRAPELALPERDIPAPLPELELHPIPTRSVTEVDIATRTREISEREIPAPLPEIDLRPSPPSELPAVTFSPHIREIAEREIALPAAPEQSSASSALEIDLTPPAEASVSRPSNNNDAWEQPARQTDTGSSLLDEQGRPRLAGTGGRAGGGLPPGTIIEDYANIDRMGTWLKRQTPGYQPGQLDQLWVPHEDILQEWVRRSIKNIWIPIPGTNKAIRCTVVLLMLGGGCGITDPNLMDNEAAARPPPEIPFKPELHEDQESLAEPQTDPER